MRRNILVLSLALIANTATLPAQSSIETGLELAMILSHPTGSIHGVGSCGVEMFETTSVSPGLGWFAAVILDLEREFLNSVRLGIGYENLLFEFRSIPNRFESFDGRDRTYTTVVTEYGSRYQIAFLRAALDVEALRVGPLRFRLGSTFRLLLDRSVVQSERIVSPAAATFLDNRQEREIEGTERLPGSSGAVTGLTVALAGKFDVGDHLYLEPAIGAELALKSFAPEWSAVLARCGLSLGYRFVGSEPIEDSPPPLPAVTEPVAEPPFSGKISARLSTGRKRVELGRWTAVSYAPLLPIIFFDRNSAEIPQRYQSLQATANSVFDERLLPAAADSAQRAMLDVVGSRLAANPGARVTLTGTTSKNESGRLRLARDRAEAIAGYLNGRWGIPRERIVVRARADAAVESSSSYPEGLAENRRVEIVLDDQALYRPVRVESVSTMLEPELLTWDISANLSRPVTRWALLLESGNRLVGRIDENGEIPASTTWRPSPEQRAMMFDFGSVSWRILAFDDDSNMVASELETLPLLLDTATSLESFPDRLDREARSDRAEFLLVTFEFDRADLTEQGRAELKQILSRIGSGSRVTITGYTDRTGEAKRNRKLARKRAEVVGRLIPDGIPTTIRGAEPHEAPYSSSTPEGRFLSRTVRVVIENPK